MFLKDKAPLQLPRGGGKKPHPQPLSKGRGEWNDE